MKTMAKVLHVHAFIALGILLTCCEARRHRGRHQHHSREQESGPRPKILKLSQSANAFGLSLYKELAVHNENLVLAPISALTAMSMVMLGANGETERNLFEGLNLRPAFGRAKKVHKAFKLYSRSMASASPNITFSIANAMYVRQEANIGRKFTKKLRKYYKGQAKYFDFTNPGGPEAPINEWVQMKTGGMIQDYLQSGSIQDDTVMWLLNAIFFKGTWEKVFREDMTRPAGFKVSTSQEVQVDMMHRDWRYRHKADEGLGVNVLELPYTGDRFSLFILLPNEADGLEALESSLTKDSLEGLLTNLSPAQRLLVYVPKFKLESSLDLVAPMQELGISQAFRRGEADLSKMNAARNLFVSKVRQKAVLEVNERGTLAAAVTGLEVSLTSLPPRFTVDHPFMFVLRDKTSRANLFIGRVINPLGSN